MQTAKRIFTVLLAVVLMLSCLVVPAFAAETKAVQVWNTSGKVSEHATVSEALAACSANQYVKLTADITEDITLESDLYLDLNGHTLSGSLNLNGYKLYGMDTTTDGYDAASAGALTAAITGGAPETSGVSVTGRRYLAVAGDNGYSFHRVYLSITNVSLDTANVGFGYKAEFYGDATVQTQIQSVGYKLWLGENRPISRDTAFKNLVTLRLKNYDVANFGATPVHAVATVTLVSGQVLESAEQAYSMQTMLELLNDTFDSFSGTQKRAVRDMANGYADAVADWDIPNILNYKTFHMAEKAGGIASYDEAAGTITATGKDNTKFFLKPSATESYARNWKVSGTITKTENKNLFFSFGVKDSSGKIQWFCVYKTGLSRQNTWNWANTYYAPDEQYVFTNRPSDFFYNKTVQYGGDKLHYELVLHDDVLKMYFGNDQEPTTLAWQLPLTEELWGGFAVDSEYQVGFYSVDPCVFVNAIDNVVTNNDTDKFQVGATTGAISYDKTAGTITAAGTGNTNVKLKASATETYARNWKVTGKITKADVTKNLFFSFGLIDETGKEQWFCVYKEGLARQKGWNWENTKYLPDNVYVFQNNCSDWFYYKTAYTGGDVLTYTIEVKDDVLYAYFGNLYNEKTLAWQLPLTEELWGGFANDSRYQFAFNSVDPCAFEISDITVETNDEADKFHVDATTGAITYDKTAGTITAAGTGNTNVKLKASATETYARNWEVSGTITKKENKNLFFSFGLIDETGKEQWFCVYKEGLARQKGWNWENTKYLPDDVYVFQNNCSDWFYYKTVSHGGDVLTFTLELENDVLKAYFGNKYNEKTLAWQLPVTEALWGGFTPDSRYQLAFNSVDPCQFVISDITVDTDDAPDTMYIASRSENLTADVLGGKIASNYDPATTDATNTEVYFAANGAGGYAKTWEMTGTVTKLEAKDNFYLSFGVRNAAGRSQWFCIRDAGLARQRYYNWADTYEKANGETVFFNQAACSFYWKEANVGSDKLYYKLALDGDILKVYFGSDFYAMHLAWELPLTEDKWGDFVPGDYYQLGITTVDPCAFEITDIKVTADNVSNNPTKLHKVENLQIRDPYVLVDEGTYYMYGTRSFGKLDVFTSTDLGVWTELAPAFAGGDDFWGNAAGSSEVEGKLAAYWAPEVFQYEGAYYMFATFTKDEEAMNQQAVVILKSDSPAGPFTVWSEDTRGYKGAVTPADHSCIDGTLYIENGVPYMIYVHQHQCKAEGCNDGMGSMAYVQLSADLKTTVGEYIECFDASDLDWISTITGHAPTVTDGPEVYTAADGQKYLLWSTHWDGDYCQIASKFDTLSASELFAAVVRRSTKIFPDTSEGTDVEVDGGHGMIFTDLNGQDVLVLHAPNAGSERAKFFNVTASASSISVAERTISTPNTPTGTSTPKYYVSGAVTNATAIVNAGQYVSSPTATPTDMTLKASATADCAKNWEFSGTVTKGTTSKSLFFSFGVKDSTGKTQWFCIYQKGLARQEKWNWANTTYQPDGEYVMANPASEHFFYKTAGLGGQKLHFTLKLENDVLRAYFGNDQYEKTLAWELPLTEELWGGFAAGSSYQLCVHSVDACQFVISDMEITTGN